MLYRTHHPFLSPNSPFPFFSLLCNHSSWNQRTPPSPSLAPFLLSHPGSSPDMECVDGAFPRDFPLQLTTPQLCFHDNASFNPQNVDDFFVDQLLDFSNDDDDQFVQQDQTSDDLHYHDASFSVSAHNSITSDLPSLPSTELTVPADDLAHLEWLSHFVEDSFSGFSATFPSPGVSSLMKSSTKVEEQLPEKGGTVSPPEPCFKTPFPVKARSKRTRTGGRVWCLGPPSLTDSSSSSTTSSTSSSPASPCLVISDRFEQEFPFSKKPRRKSPAEKSRPAVGGPQPPRRCSHCGVQKTPQWRTGPLGAKTLCNACGVRFKSGRLLPEYRPACSPTFSIELHSNHHRKVLEMRRKKEIDAPADILTLEKN